MHNLQVVLKNVLKIIYSILTKFKIYFFQYKIFIFEFLTSDLRSVLYHCLTKNVILVYFKLIKKKNY